MADQVESTNSKRKKRLVWKEVSEAALLDIWPSKMNGLRGQRKNSHIYAEMAEYLNQLGFMCSPRDIQVKLQNFTQRYRKEKAAMGISGGLPSTWAHYDTVHQIIGSCKANIFPELTLESIGDVPNTSMALSPATPLSTPSSPLSLSPSSSSPGPLSSKEPAKKKRKFDFREVVLQKFENCSNEIANHLKKYEKLEQEFLEIEKKKAETLEKIAEGNRKVSKALLSFLNKK